MGSADVLGQLRGAGSHGRAEVAATLVRLACDVGADVVETGGDVLAASGFERWGLRGDGGGNSGLVSRSAFTVRPVPDVWGVRHDPKIGPAR